MEEDRLGSGAADVGLFPGARSFSKVSPKIYVCMQTYQLTGQLCNLGGAYLSSYCHRTHPHLPGDACGNTNPLAGLRLLSQVRGHP